MQSSPNGHEHSLWRHHNAWYFRDTERPDPNTQEPDPPDTGSGGGGLGGEEWKTDYEPIDPPENTGGGA